MLRLQVRIRGASFLVKQNVYRSFDFMRATAFADRALNLPPLEDGGKASLSRNVTWRLICRVQRQ